jgi:hypothetical protein
METVAERMRQCVLLTRSYVDAHKSLDTNGLRALHHAEAMLVSKSVRGLLPLDVRKRNESERQRIAQYTDPGSAA